MKLCELFDILDEINIDNRNGAGAVPDNLNVDYLGLRVQMKPSMFLKLAAKLDHPESAAELEDYIKKGGAIGAPFLNIQLPDEWFDDVPDFEKSPRISGHEGRNRMIAVQRAEGDNPVEVHLFFRGGLRRRHLTPEIIERLQYNTKGIFNQNGKFLLDSPLFKLENTQQLNELLSTTYKYKQVNSEEYVFKTDQNIKYIVLLMSDSYQTDDGKWHRAAEVQFGIYDPDDEFATTKISHSGDAFKVFATVGKIIQQHVTKNPDLEYIKFTANLEEPSRVKLYDSLMRLIPKFVPGWKFDKSVSRYGERWYVIKKT